ncbi:chorismate mutase [Streptomyces sp. NPDC094448]|uniref:chorismate mutase n=1 Tax=Streptomyces sp. NPDC094448 TaxID=3366063 RepID=UPI0037F83979
MSETVEGGSAPDRLAGPSEPDELDRLDEQLIALVLLRARQARGRQSDRRASGLPVSPLARENAMLRRYTERLGREGTAIALAVLALSRHR